MLETKTITKITLNEILKKRGKLFLTATFEFSKKDCLLRLETFQTSYQDNVWTKKKRQKALLFTSFPPPFIGLKLLLIFHDFH